MWSVFGGVVVGVCQVVDVFDEFSYYGVQMQVFVIIMYIGNGVVQGFEIIFGEFGVVSSKFVGCFVYSQML